MVIFSGYALLWLISTAITLFGLWASGKVNYIRTDFQAMMVISASVSIISLIPYVGIIFSAIFFVFLLMNVSGCKFMEAFWVMCFTRLFSLIPLVFFSSWFIEITTV